MRALLPAEVHRTDLYLDAGLRHSHENPRGCIAVEHGAKSTEFMMALSILRPQHWTTSSSSREEMKSAHKAQQPTKGARKES